METEVTEDFTIYHVSVVKFRIVEEEENHFSIQRLFKETETTGYLWWKKTTVAYKWKMTDKYGKKFFVMTFSPYASNIKEFVIYNTLEEAKKWIEDFEKYPIYH